MPHHNSQHEHALDISPFHTTAFAFPFSYAEMPGTLFALPSPASLMFSSAPRVPVSHTCTSTTVEPSEGEVDESPVDRCISLSLNYRLLIMLHWHWYNATIFVISSKLTMRPLKCKFPLVSKFTLHSTASLSIDIYLMRSRWLSIYLLEVFIAKPLSHIYRNGWSSFHSLVTLLLHITYRFTTLYFDTLHFALLNYIFARLYAALMLWPPATTSCRYSKILVALWFLKVSTPRFPPRLQPLIALTFRLIYRYRLAYSLH
jgi:hypothetical protein